jgi:hypothetical protein
MTYRGLARGRTIELDEPLPYPEGQPVNVAVQPITTPFPPGSPAAIRKVMHEPPHLDPEAVAELERAIEEGQLPVQQEGVFDEDQ